MQDVISTRYLPITDIAGFFNVKLNTNTIMNILFTVLRSLSPELAAKDVAVTALDLTLSTLDLLMCMRVAVVSV
jgi:hypothetical protein